MMRLKMTQATRLSHLIEGLKMPVESREFRIKIKVDTFKETGPEIISGLEQYTKLMEGWTKAEPNYEGIRVQCGPEQGWFLLRLSLHDPVLPFNMESDIQGGLKKMLDKLHPFFSPLGNLIDIQSLTDYMK
jgi:phosphomannomutase